VRFDVEPCSASTSNAANASWQTSRNGGPRRRGRRAARGGVAVPRALNIGEDEMASSAHSRRLRLEAPLTGTMLVEPLHVRQRRETGDLGELRVADNRVPDSAQLPPDRRCS
jgi:hypothetical protein